MHCNGWASDSLGSETNTHEERRLTDVQYACTFLPNCLRGVGNKRLAGVLTDVVRVIPHLGYNITKKNMNGFWVLGFGIKATIF